MRFARVLAAGAVAACLAGARASAEEDAPEGTTRAEVAGVEVVDMQGATRVTLKAEGAGGEEGARLVDIYVGPAEGAAIARAREGIETPRPMTHDLLASVVKELGGEISRLTVSSLEGGTYIGELTIVCRGDEGEGDVRELKIDTRPSDGMALAVAAGAPIYVADGVIEQAGRPEPEKKAEEEGPRRPRPFGPPRGLI
ncbi:MAG: bifunctional nuclease family protein [Planctomycetota bacterium]|jgi:bifunctional DNase/RNase